MSPFVLIADMDSDVITVTIVVVNINTIDCPKNGYNFYSYLDMHFICM